MRKLYTNQNSLPNNSKPHSPPPHHPGFNATILSQNGTDITSHFEIRVFQPPPAEKALSNLTDRNASPMRLINFCPSVSEVFTSSYCQSYSGSATSSLQHYTTVCREDFGPPWPSADGRSRYNHHSGFCDADEICVTLTKENWRTDGRPSMPPVAACVETSAYQLWRALDGWWYDEGEEPEWVRALKFAGMKITAVASEMDGRTGLEMGRLGVEAGVGGEEVEKEVCSGCLRVGTKKLPVGTDSLGVEATAMTVGTGVAMGILWVAVMSG